MLRIALCLSGQMRTYRICYNNLKKNILEPLQPDIFVHTWKNTGFTHHSKGILPRKFSDVQPHFPENMITYAELNELYAPKRAVIEEYDPNFTEEMKGIRVPDELKQAEPDHYKGSLPMFYKIKKCNDLKCEWENDNSFKYDVVIRLRPDLMIEELIPSHIFSNLDVLWHSDYWINPKIKVSDKFALASSEIMDYYSSVFECLSNYWLSPLGDGTSDKHRVGERLLKYHMDLSPFSVIKFSNKCFIKRVTPSRGRKLQLYNKLYKLVKNIMPSKN